jgi:hypothetical protein
MKVAQINLNFPNCVDMDSNQVHYQSFAAAKEKEADIQALLDSIKVLFIDEGISFEFYVFGRMTTEISDIINGVRKRIPMVPVQIKSENRGDLEKLNSYNAYILRSYNILSLVIIYDFD